MMPKSYPTCNCSKPKVIRNEKYDAYRRGAEAMREAAALGLDRLLTKKKATAIWVAPDEIRALPLPEDKP